MYAEDAGPATEGANLIGEVSGEVGFGPRRLDLGTGAVVTEGRKVAGDG